jgi:dephospho-CoA kinase
MQGPLHIGLTGGIGSGKSTVAALLAAEGAAIVDADAISRQTTAAGGLAIPAIREAFGPAYVNEQGALDRDRMRQLAFSDPTARRRLEQIIHPLVAQQTRHEADLAAARGVRCIVFDVPLLVESAHWRGRVDAVLVVDCRVETQVTRVMQRNGLERAVVESIIAQQARRADRLQAADHVVYNDGIDLPELGRQLATLARRFGL